MSNESKRDETKRDESPRAKSFQDVLQRNQEFIAHLQSLQEDVAGQLAAKEKELGDARQQVELKQKELDDLQNAQLQWAVDRQSLLDEHDTLKKLHQELAAKHDRARQEVQRIEQARQEILNQQDALKQQHKDLSATYDRTKGELGRVQEEASKAKARDDDRRSQLRQLEQERMQLTKTYEAEKKKLEADSKLVQADLDSLQSAQLQWAMDRESLIKERDAAVGKQAQLEQEWQGARAQLTDDKKKLEAANAQLDMRVKTLQEELDPLKQARGKWQGERERLIADVARLEQDAQEKESSHKLERKTLQADLDQLQKRVAELGKLEPELKRVTEERSALLAKVKGLEQDWQTREETIGEQRASWKKQQESTDSKFLAMQRDYEKIKALHEDLAGESGKRAEEWTAREQRLTADKNQLKVDLERIQGQLSEMMKLSNELQAKRDAEGKELEVAWQREKNALKTQLEEARKAANSGPPQSQVLARYESEKRALLVQIDSLKGELSTAGRSKDAPAALIQAKRDFEAKFRVIYDQSHDLNSPLNAILGFSEILLDERGNKTTPEERREFVAHINESGKRLVEHIRELIEFAKQEAGIQERPVQLVPPVGVGTKAPVILVADNDPAVKDRIEPFLSHAGYEVVMAASAQEALKKAVQLQPLAVLIDTQLPPNGGNGLLYDLKRETKTRDIPVVLTSKVNKESLGFDIGQCDFLTKPIDRQQLLQMMVKFDLLADGQRGKKTPSSILIIDDDPQNIRLVKAMLKPFNMEVFVADGGKAGLELALKKKPDLIILDLMMPDVDGFEVVSKLRDDPAGSKIPILIYTAKNISSEDRERLQGNIQTIIQKGDFGKDRFLEMINNLQTTAQAS
jgi:CheY-like chemotaxis protein